MQGGTKGESLYLTNRGDRGWLTHSFMEHFETAIAQEPLALLGFR